MHGRCRIRSEPGISYGFTGVGNQRRVLRLITPGTKANTRSLAYIFRHDVDENVSRGRGKGRGVLRSKQYPPAHAPDVSSEAGHATGLGRYGSYLIYLDRPPNTEP